MSEFCKECSIVQFGEDFHELAGQSTAADTAKGLFVEAICEGCGFVMVDHEGRCMGGGYCLENHQHPGEVWPTTI